MEEPLHLGPRERQSGADKRGDEHTRRADQPYDDAVGFADAAHIDPPMREYVGREDRGHGPRRYADTANTHPSEDRKQ
jgi:hypothetical protein